MAYQPIAQQLPQGPVFHPPPSPPDMGPKPTRTRVSNERNTPPYPQSHAHGAHPPQLPSDAQPDGQVAFYAQPYIAHPPPNGVPPPPGVPQTSNGAPLPPGQAACFLAVPGGPPPPGMPGPPHGAPPLPILYTQAPFVGAPGTPPSSGSPSTGGSLPSAPPRSPSESAQSPGGIGSNHYAPSTSVPRLPPILQVEKQQVTTTATQAASASRRRNEAHFVCPVPGCGSTFTRRFNLRGHLRSHTEERPYVCEWPGCGKGFARQHDCKRHQALHSQRTQTNVCQGCKKTFSRLDALNRHLRSDGGVDCRRVHKSLTANSNSPPADPNGGDPISPLVASAPPPSADGGGPSQNGPIDESEIKKDVDMADPPLSSQTPVSSARGS